MWARFVRSDASNPVNRDRDQIRTDGRGERREENRGDRREERREPGVELRVPGVGVEIGR